MEPMVKVESKGELKHGLEPDTCLQPPVKKFRRSPSVECAQLSDFFVLNQKAEEKKVCTSTKPSEETLATSHTTTNSTTTTTTSPNSNSHQIENLTKPNYPTESYLLPKYNLDDLRVSHAEFLQDRSCILLPLNRSICCECNYYATLNNNQNNDPSQTTMCRFYEFRRLKFLNNGILRARGFLDPFTAPSEDDKNLWRSSSKSAFEPNEDLCKYILKHIGYQFCKIIAQEMYAFQYFAEQHKRMLWKRAIRGLRELCDLCATTIFNMHWICPKCAFCLCLDCFKYPTAEFITVYDHKCTIDSTKHTSKKLVLVQMIAGDIMIDLHERYHHFMKKYNLQTIVDKECPLVEQMQRLLMFSAYNISPQVMSREFQVKPILVYNEHGKQILRLNYNDDRDPIKFCLFQNAWKMGDPVVVSDVNKYLNSDIWKPKSFSEDFGDHKCFLIDCSDGKTFSSHLLRVFWDGFDDASKRLVDDKGNRRLLKLKDWPPGDDFAEVMPSRFQNLMEKIPFPDYANRTGKLNIASYLPDYFIKPDLGPKMYTAYGSALQPNKGTTNLHLDVSDAVNIMIYVGVSNEEPQFDMGANEAAVGAIWHIYHASDADKIRKFLKKVHSDRHLPVESNMDPIHDQSWYLDKELRQRLFYECGVEGFVIMQKLGDAVFIPAGSPHQVKNLQSCIKVAEDFVSPENVAHCCYLTQEFRYLSESHTNHEDKLQIKNIIYHTTKEMISALNSFESDV